MKLMIACKEIQVPPCDCGHEPEWETWPMGTEVRFSDDVEALNFISKVNAINGDDSLYVYNHVTLVGPQEPPV